MNKQPTYTYKKLNYLYVVHETYTAGIVLEGWEAKALDSFAGNIDAAYCIIRNGNAVLINSKIMPSHNHLYVGPGSEVRERSLLLNRTELTKIVSKLDQKGFTCIPMRLYRNDKRLWKLDIAICTGKKNWDRREDIKKRDIEREIKNNG